MAEKHFIIATAGHVDHGKSALVKALTGTDPDRLPEEKARSITIDLGFAELNLIAPNGDKIHAGIVDVPGHEDFVRNMIAGVGSVDLALFVVAADDGWMPQSEEHMQILTYLGVEHAVIALTKSDLGEIDIQQIRNHLADTPFVHAPIIPTSVRTGEGVDDLKRALAAELATAQPRRDYGKPRLFIDRVFSLRGIGTIVTGTLTGGQLRRGQKIILQPGNFEARIRSIQSHGADREFTQPGMRTAINLPDIAIQQIRRGDVVTVVDLGEASSSLLVQLERSPRLNLARPFKNGTSVYLHHGTSRVAARIAFLGKDGSALLKLAAPIFAFLGDRFVLRDPSEQHTIGGGVVVDPDGEWRHEFSIAPDDVDLCVRSEIEARGFVRKETLLRKSHFSASQIAEALERLQRGNQIVVRGNIAADAAAWQKMCAEATGLIDNLHQRNPERAGLDLNELRAGLRDQSADVFEALIEDLCRNGFVRIGAGIARASHQATLRPEIQPAAAEIRAALAAKPFDPPARREIAKDPRRHEALRFLIQQNEAIDISVEVVLLREAAKQMQSKIAAFISRNGSATVSELRQELGTSRRILIPFLEHLDRAGITRREGDRRRLYDQ
jgi:selenocysteine-specific elongation factor